MNQLRIWFIFYEIIYMKKALLMFFMVSFLSLSFGQADGVPVNGPVKKALFQDNLSISIFPNPAFDYIKINENDNIKEIVITDLMGKTLKRFVYARGVQYNIQDLRKGMYLVQIIGKNNGIMKTQRMLKNDIQ